MFMFQDSQNILSFRIEKLYTKQVKKELIRENNWFDFILFNRLLM